MSKLKQYFATISCGAGMTTQILVEASDLKGAERIAREECIDWAGSFGYYQDIDYFGDYDQLYEESSWDDEEYLDVSELDYSVCEYNKEEHEDLL